jgi:catechol 2,3-dioxygenase-like lactoylglutathione lyase family enzyme
MGANARSPSLFRVLLPARDLARSRRFYEKLLAVRGRIVAPGRVYFDCGSVILGLLDYSRIPKSRWPEVSEALYFAVRDLDAVHRRARSLRCLSRELLHGDRASPMGEICVRPWGERSFYADDPAGHPLCFVDDRTLFTGSPSQVARLSRPPRSG